VGIREQNISTSNGAREIYVDGIKFIISHWEFNNEGMYGHIYFLVPNGVYEYGSNNGAYMKLYNGNFYSTEGEREYDLAHAATSCFLDDDISRYTFEYIITEAAKFIDFNTLRKKQPIALEGEVYANVEKEEFYKALNEWIEKNGWKHK